MLIGISVGLFIVIFFLTQTLLQLRLELHKACPLPIEACPYKSGIPIEAVASFILAATIGTFGMFLILTEKILMRGEVKLGKLVKSLVGDEKKIYELISEAGGSILQGDIVKKSGYSKVKVSRILDGLEAKGLIERRRRGMANLVIIK